MRLLFDHLFFRHVNESSRKESGSASRVLVMAEHLLQNKLVSMPLSVLEHVAGWLLALPIPIYSSLVYAIVTNARGLPHFGGMYLRALYYRRKLGSMAPNVLIDQGVFFAHPKGVHLAEFCYIDKQATIMSITTKVGRRVHIAPRVFINGGGDFEAEDYAGISANVNIITSSEVLSDGARCSGPMVSPDQRNVIRGKVLIQKDAFVGTNATILPGVTLATGSVAGAGVVLTKSTEPWGIYVGTKAKNMIAREPVRWPDN